MKYLDCRERIFHGTFDFPIELYKVDSKHPRYYMIHHWHPECELIKINKGSIILTLDSAEVRASAGDVVYVADGTLHSGRPIDECEYECLVFGTKWVSSGGNLNIRRMQNILEHKCAVNTLFKAGDAGLDSIISPLFDEMDKRSPGYELTVTGCLMQFYGYVLKHGLYSNVCAGEVKSGGQQKMLKDILTFIEENFSKKITLADLSRCAGMSPKYFCSVFYKMTRQTPIDYLNSYRVECACEKLLTTGGNVTEIALSCGFNDLSYFTKTFKKYKNITPLAYRRSDV